MTTNTDVLISILQGGQIDSPCDVGGAQSEACAILSDAWRRQPGYFIASNDLQCTSLRFHLTAIELKDTWASVTKGYECEDEELPSVMVACQVCYLGEALTPLVYSAICTHGTRCTTDPPLTHSSVDTETPSQGSSRIVWRLDEWLTLPLPLSDVPLDADVRCTVWSASAGLRAQAAAAARSPRSLDVVDDAWQPCAVARVFPFSPSGELRTGSHLFSLAPTQSTTRSHVTDSRACHGEVGPAVLALRASEQLRTGRLQSIPWLDLVTEQHLGQTYRQAPSTLLLSSSSSLSAHGVLGRDHAAQDVIGQVHLAFPLASNRLPIVQFPLLVDGLAASSPPPPAARAAPQATSTSLAPSSTPRAGPRTLSSAFAPTIFRPFVDRYKDVHHHAWSESVATLQARSLFLSDSHTSAVPDYADRQRLTRLLRQHPPVQLEPLRVQEASLLWQYREFIRHDARYFLPFMRSVSWRGSQASAVRRAAEALIPLWKPIGFADVLACLSCEFYGVRAVRQYAVRLLARESDAHLTLFAVPLLQAMLFDDPAERELGSFLIHRSLASWELCSALFWTATVEAEEEQRILAARQIGKNTTTTSASAAALLLPAVVGPFTAWRERHQQALQRHQPYFVALLRQEQRAERWLHALAAQVEKSGGDRTLKNEVGQRLLEKKGCGLKALFDKREEGLSSGGGGGGSEAAMATDASLPGSLVAVRETAATTALPYAPITLPTHPAIALYGVVPQSFFMFKSATLPFQVSLLGTRLTLPAPATTRGAASLPSPDGLGGGDLPTEAHLLAAMVRRPLAMPRDADRRRETSSPAPPIRPGTFAALGAAPTSTTTATTGAAPVVFPMAIMYKWNDEVRQDQLVLQLIRLIDTVLRLDGLDLCLTPYSVVATGAHAGLIEMVPDVVTFQSVQKDVRGYLRRFHRSAEALESAMERFTQSFAGYSIITFVLGIGDRHLENILLTRDGRLLHIDFAYMLGYDPKPFAPPMKINAEMIEALGGPQSRGYHAFRSYCCSAYHTLRKHAALLLYTIQLMVYANGMPQLTGAAQPLAEEPSLTPPMRTGGSGAATATRASATSVSGAGAGAAAAAASQDPRANVLRVQEKLRLDLTNAQATQFLQNVMADSVGSLFTNLWDTLHAAAQATRA